MMLFDWMQGYARAAFLWILTLAILCSTMPYWMFLRFNKHWRQPAESKPVAAHEHLRQGLQFIGGLMRFL